MGVIKTKRRSYSRNPKELFEFKYWGFKMERKKGKEKSDEKGKEREKKYKGTEEGTRKKG